MYIYRYILVSIVIYSYMLKCRSDSVWTMLRTASHSYVYDTIND